VKLGSTFAPLGDPTFNVAPDDTSSGIVYSSSATLRLQRLVEVRIARRVLPS
jgi:hypothetical protein